MDNDAFPEAAAQGWDGPWYRVRTDSFAHVIRQHAAGIADVFAAAVDPDEDAPEEGQDPSSVAPC